MIFVIEYMIILQLLYAAEQGIAEEVALQRGMADKSREFVDAGAELYQGGAISQSP